MKVLLVGGGVGGLALALSLHDAGVTDVHILESASAIKEVGVGINVLPHATRELAELGLLDDLRAVGIPTEQLSYYTEHGQRIWSEPRGLRAGYAWPQFSIHRGDLLALLHRAVIERLGADRIHTDHAVTQVGQTAGGAWVTTASSPNRREADVVVACDGVHSVIRRTFYPDEGPPKWNGITMWRGTTHMPAFLSGRTMIMAGVIAKRIVAYPISKRAEDHGRALVNWVAEVRTADHESMSVADWQFRATADEPLGHFGSFNFDFLDVPSMISGSNEIFRYPMIDRDPLPTWNFGSITLLGDAAHPMYPVGSNGASQAIIDARVLARELVLGSSIEGAIAAYDAQRRPATAAVVEANRQVGPEQSMEIVAHRAPNGFTNLDDVITQEELHEISARYKRTAGFDPELLNSRASLSVR